MSEQVSQQSDMLVNRDRLEFLFDGIFAIAMTILVLELKVPDLADRHSTPELAAGLLHHGATFISYLLSFFMLGMFWYSHNYWFRHIDRISRGMLVFQLLQLAAAAFFPFCAALLGRYPTNPLSLAVYLGCAATYLWAGTILWIIAMSSGALKPSAGATQCRLIRKGHIAGSLGITFMFCTYLLISLTR